jgi:hypothetical protein
MSKEGATIARQSGFKQEVLSFEDLFEQARQLSLEDKALSILENLSNLESDVGIGASVPYNLYQHPGGPGWDLPTNLAKMAWHTLVLSPKPRSRTGF